MHFNVANQGTKSVRVCAGCIICFITREAGTIIRKWDAWTRFPRCQHYYIKNYKLYYRSALMALLINN